MTSADTTFVPKVTTIKSTWLQPVNDLVWKGHDPLYVTSTQQASSTYTLANTTLVLAVANGYDGRGTLTYTSNANVAVGQAVSGTGIPSGTFIQNVISTTSATITTVATPGTGLTLTAAANAYLITLPTASLYSSFVAGDRFTFKAHMTNGGPATLKIAGSALIGPGAIKKQGTTALVGGEIQSGSIVTVEYDGTNFQLITSQIFDTTTYSQQNLAAAPFGIFSTWHTTSDYIAYGFASNVYRDGGTSLTVGGQFSAFSTSGASPSGICFGVASQAIANPGSHCQVVGGEFAAINESDTGSYSTVTFTGSISGVTLTAGAPSGLIPTNSKVTGSGVSANTFISKQLTGTTGLAGTYEVTVSQSASSTAMSVTAYTMKIAANVVFKDRYDWDTNVSDGLTNNIYNANSIALWVTSQKASSSGEHCGFRYGILFDEYALDEDKNGTAVGIDFTNIHYLSPATPTPLNSYKMTAAIRFRDFQSILWNAGPGTATESFSLAAPTDPASPIRTYFNPALSKWCISNTAIEVFGVYVPTGAIYVQANKHLESTGGYSTLVWHEVGNDGGATSFNPAWQNLGGAGNSNASYTRDALGWIHLRGVVTGGTITTNIFILPSGYRPAYFVNLACVSNAAFGQIQIASTGAIACTVGNNAYVCLDGISFRTD